jgi:hypothetical protein
MERQMSKKRSMFGSMTLHYTMPETFQMLCDPDEPAKFGTRVLGNVTCKRCWRVIKWSNKNGNTPLTKRIPNDVWKRMLDGALPKDFEK